MTWLVNKLKHRVQVMSAYDIPNDSGGADRCYRKLATIWAGFEENTYRNMFASYIRSEQIATKDTHYFIIRYQAVAGIHSYVFGQAFGADFSSDPGGFGREFDTSFSSAFDSIVDMNPIKSDLFIFLLREGKEYRGRLFKILGVTNVNERDEYLKLSCEEIEERGT